MTWATFWEPKSWTSWRSVSIRRLQSWASQRNVGHMASKEKGRHGSSRHGHRGGREWPSKKSAHSPFFSGSMKWKVLFPAWKAKFQVRTRRLSCTVLFFFSNLLFIVCDKISELKRFGVTCYFTHMKCNHLSSGVCNLLWDWTYMGEYLYYASHLEYPMS